MGSEGQEKGISFLEGQKFLILGGNDPQGWEKPPGKGKNMPRKDRTVSP